MSDSEGDLLRYHIEQTNARFDRIEEKIDRLLEFKWQIIGGSVILSAIVGLVMSLIGFGKT